MNIIIKNREIKKRPKLADFLKVYRELMDSDPDMTKEIFQEKMRLFFSGAPIDLNRVDDRYNALAEKFQQVQGEMYKQQKDLNELIGDMEAFEFDAFSST